MRRGSDLDEHRPAAVVADAWSRCTTCARSSSARRSRGRRSAARSGAGSTRSGSARRGSWGAATARWHAGTQPELNALPSPGNVEAVGCVDDGAGCAGARGRAAAPRAAESVHDGVDEDARPRRAGPRGRRRAGRPAARRSRAIPASGVHRQRRSGCERSVPRPLHGGSSRTRSKRRRRRRRRAASASHDRHVRGPQARARSPAGPSARPAWRSTATTSPLVAHERGQVRRLAARAPRRGPGRARRAAGRRVARDALRGARLGRERARRAQPGWATRSSGPSRTSASPSRRPAQALGRRRR